MEDGGSKILYSIGYGNSAPDDFVAKLKDAGVTVVLDVRRKGSRSWNGKYNHGLAMEKLMSGSDIKYGNWDSLGNKYGTLADYCIWLGGKRPQKTLYALAKCVDWGKRVDTYCLLCAEGNPYEGHGMVGGAPVVRCHRVYVAEGLVEQLGDGWTIEHLR